MASDGDDNGWFTRGPVAWFVMATIVAFVAGLVAAGTTWGVLEIRLSERFIGSAIDANRISELDLTAQRTMAWAAVATVVLLVISVAFVTVASIIAWKTYNNQTLQSCATAAVLDCNANYQNN